MNITRQEIGYGLMIASIVVSLVLIFVGVGTI
jgi:hypothetical protein